MRRSIAIGCGLALALFVGALVGQGGAWAQEPAGPDPNEHEVRQLLKQQIAALNAESADAVMLCFHHDAPDREGMRRVLVNQFRVRDLRYELLKSHFIGVDGKYAYMRTWQRVNGLDEKIPFRGNTEELLVFRRGRGGQWKAWTSARLDKERVPLPGEKGAPPR